MTSTRLPSEFSSSTGLRSPQHAKMDHLETIRAFGKMDDAEKDTAIDDLIELVVAVDGCSRSRRGSMCRILPNTLAGI